MAVVFGGRFANLVEFLAEGGGLLFVDAEGLGDGALAGIYLQGLWGAWGVVDAIVSFIVDPLIGVEGFPIVDLVGDKIMVMSKKYGMVMVTRKGYGDAEEE